MHYEIFGLKMIGKKVKILKRIEKISRLKMMGKKDTNKWVNSKLFGLRMREKMVQILE